METELIKILAEAGQAGVSLALVLLVWKVIQILSNHLSELRETLTELKDTINELRDEVREWRLVNGRRKR